MAHENKVLRSINAPDAARCVDIFVRPDGTFGFEEFRRDAEDANGWFAIGGFAAKAFATEQDAFDQALAAVAWFRKSAEPAPGSG